MKMESVGLEEHAVNGCTRELVEKYLAADWRVNLAILEQSMLKKFGKKSQHIFRYLFTNKRILGREKEYEANVRFKILGFLAIIGGLPIPIVTLFIEGTPPWGPIVVSFFVVFLGIWLFYLSLDS